MITDAEVDYELAQLDSEGSASPARTGGGWLDQLTGFIGAGATLAQAFRRPSTTATPSPAAPAATGSLPAWLVPAGIGVAIIIALAMFLRR